MNQGKLVFAQVIAFVHPQQFQRCVSKYPMPRSSRTFSAWDQFLCMVFAQLTFREGLRDIEACLSSQARLLYAMGIRGTVAKSNLAYANENRDWRVYFELAQILMRKARALYSSERYVEEIDQIVYALDASVVDLCMALFPWARFRRRKSAIKIHAIIDLQGSIPVFVAVTDGKVHDVNALDWIVFEARAFYVMDRGYVDFARLKRVDAARAYFVTRAKANMSFYACGPIPTSSKPFSRLYSPEQP